MKNINKNKNIVPDAVGIWQVVEQSKSGRRRKKKSNRLILTLLEPRRFRCLLRMHLKNEKVVMLMEEFQPPSTLFISN